MISWELYHRDPDCVGWQPRLGGLGLAAIQEDGRLLLEDGDEFSGWFLLEDDTDGTAGILLEDA
jgi:hypothetical protein